MALRRAALSASALAFPPFSPPRRPRAAITALIASALGSGGAVVFGNDSSPTAWRTTRSADSVGSSCLIRFGMAQRYAWGGSRVKREASAAAVKLTHYPQI